MSPAAGKSFALGSVLAAGALASVDSISKGQLPPLRLGLGVFLAGAMLLALAEVDARLAAGFGGLVLAGAVLRDGVPAARRLDKALS